MIKSRSEFDSDKKKKFKGNYLQKEQRLEYFERLIKPYKKKETQFFILQYLDGDGNELNQKFWSIHSSSRFAFELYSWMAKDPRVSSFEFEKKLVGLKGSPKRPNMDVYFEIGDKIYFIESKFSESSSQNIDNLSESYYLEKGEAKNSRGDAVNSELSERYRGDKVAANKFSQFIEFVKQQLDGKNYKSCWMDFKQEITHLVGIYLTVKSSKGIYNEKTIEFLNVYYDFGDTINPAVGWFFGEAQKLMRELLKGTVKDFVYKHMSAQKLVEDKYIVKFDPKTIAFGMEKNTISEQLREHYDFII